eukprot:gene11973-13210_t
MGIQDTIKKNWFMIGIGLVILLAKLAPWIGKKGGLLYPEITVKYIAVSVIFFNGGVSLKTEDLKAALLNVKVHVFIQCFTFCFIPTFMYVIVSMMLKTSINEWLLKGILIVGCMPPPVSSAVIITKAIGGNEAAAIFNSAFGSFLGIFVTPLLLFMVVGVSSDVPVMKIVSTLSVTVVFPLIIGQVVRRYIKEWMQRTQPPFGTIGSCMLLLIIYTTFCDTFNSDMGTLAASEIFIIGILIIAIQIFFISLIYLVSSSNKLSYTPQDVVALLFCATHKSLTLGMPMLKIIYAGDEHLPLITIPLLLYHPTQILLGGFLVPVVKNWLDSFNFKDHASTSTSKI